MSRRATTTSSFAQPLQGLATASLARSSREASPRRAPGIVRTVVRAPGLALDPNVRADLEPRFGQDFSRVRIHTDATAASSASAVSARAYTVGDHIAFAAGAYEPSTREGRHLLAHELVHTIQQRPDTTSQSLPAKPVPSKRAGHDFGSVRILGGPRVARQVGAQRGGGAQPPCVPQPCPAEQTELIRTALYTAISGVEYVLQALERSRRVKPAVLRIVRSVFRGASPETVATVRRNLGGILGCLRAQSTRPMLCGCVPAGVAAQTTTQIDENSGSVIRFDITFNPSHPTFRRATDRLYEASNAKNRLRTAVHECAHAIGVTGRDVYEQDPGFAGLTTPEALQTPDKYAKLVDDVLVSEAIGPRP